MADFAWVSHIIVGEVINLLLNWWSAILSYLMYEQTKLKWVLLLQRHDWCYISKEYWCIEIQHSFCMFVSFNCGTMCATSGAGTIYLSGTNEYIACFSEGRYADFLVFCVVFYWRSLCWFFSVLCSVLLEVVMLTF